MTLQHLGKAQAFPPDGAQLWSIGEGRRGRAVHECCRLPVLFELLQTLPQAEPLLYSRVQDLNLVGAGLPARGTGALTRDWVTGDR